MLRVEAPEGRAPERRYVLDLVLGERLGLDWELSPGPAGRVTLLHDGSRLTLPDMLLATDRDRWLTPSSLPLTPLTRAAIPGPFAAGLVEPELPILYGDPRGDRISPIIITEGGDAEVSLDIFGSIFFLLARYEELVVATRDEHDRFPALASVTGGREHLERPLADEYVELLWAVMAHLWPDLRRRSPRPRLHLTHDVDFGRFAQSATLATAIRATVADIVKRREPGLAGRRAAAYVGGRIGRDVRGDPLDRFDDMMTVAERHGLRSAFYFVASRSGGPFDATYDIAEPWVERTMRRIVQRGHEIGLHASYASHRDPSRVRLELERLRAITERAGAAPDGFGGRHHYLRWHNPDSWRAWSEAGLAYDSTLGYAEAPGFRAGTAYDYPAFDVAGGERLALRERPLVVMDVSLRGYLGASPEDTYTRTVELARRARRVGGSFVLLWHNTSVVGAAQRRLYGELVAALAPLFG